MKEEKQKEEKKESKTKKENKAKKDETVLEVNEITKESIEKEKKINEEKLEAEKKIQAQRRKENFNKFIKKIFRGADINKLVIILMYIFFAIVALSVSVSTLRRSFSTPGIKVLVTDKALKELSAHNPKNIDSINIDLETFDIRIKESNDEKINIRYNKKYDKKISIKTINGKLIIEEKNKLFKIVRFDSLNNDLIVEIPRGYKGGVEGKSINGTLTLEKYKLFEEVIEEQDKENKSFDNFFNI